MRPLRSLAAACLALVAFPSVSAATIYGYESNGELINSDRTRPLQAEALDTMKRQGAQVVRVNAGWNEIALEGCASRTLEQLKDPDNGCYRWDVVDGVVQQASDRGILVLASFSRAPHWLHRNANTSYLGATSREWTRSVQHYVAFMQAAATRYTAGSPHGHIRLWTVWNEPNSKTYFAPMHTPALLGAAPRRYAQLYGYSARVIRAANRQALIAPGPTGPNSTIKPVTFIRQVQRFLPTYLPGTGATERRYINAWAHNPYPGVTTAPSRGRISSPAIGMTNIRDLFRELDRAAVTRRLPVWATEFSYETNPPEQTFGVPPHVQGRFMGEAFDWLDSTNRVTVAVWYGLTDPIDSGNWQSGTYYASGTPKASLAWAQRAISVPIGRTRRGSAVRVWARSMVNPRATRIAVSTNGRTWRLLAPVGRKRDGTTILRTRVLRTTWFATWDGQRGPARVVVVR